MKDLESEDTLSPYYVTSEEPNRTRAIGLPWVLPLALSCSKIPAMLQPSSSVWGMYILEDFLPTLMATVKGMVNQIHQVIRTNFIRASHQQLISLTRDSERAPPERGSGRADQTNAGGSW